MEYILNEDKLKRGHKCPKCGKEAKWVAYVYAHWNDEIIYTCECGQKVSICRGCVIEEGKE